MFSMTRSYIHSYQSIRALVGLCLLLGLGMMTFPCAKRCSTHSSLLALWIAQGGTANAYGMSPSGSSENRQSPHNQRRATRVSFSEEVQDHIKSQDRGHSVDLVGRFFEYWRVQGALTFRVPKSIRAHFFVCLRRCWGGADTSGTLFYMSRLQESIHGGRSETVLRGGPANAQ